MIKAVNDNESWTLNVKTHSRDELIDISRVIANSFDIAFFQDPDSIPHILIPGNMGGGKSMIAEAMIKTLLDEYDPDDMKRPDAKRGMFIEKYPSYACSHYCQAIGHTNGSPVIYGFDRVTPRYDFDSQNKLIKAFQQAARKHGTPPVGAIFTSNESIGETKPWLVLNLKIGDDEWDRSLEIKVLNYSLTSTSQFKYYWRHMEKFSKTGTLPEPALIKFATLPRDIFSKNIVYFSMSPATNGAAIYEVELLKFAFWHHNLIGLSKAMVAQIAANLSDYGDTKKVDHFVDWLKEKGEHDFISNINVCKSKLVRLFFKYAAPDTYKFDVSKFMQYALEKRKHETENPKDLQNKYQSYFASQMNGTDNEKIRNFLFVISTFVDDGDLERLLKKTFKEPKNPKAFKSPAEQRRLQAIGNLYTMLDDETFPLTKRRLKKIYRANNTPLPKTDDVINRLKPQISTLQPVA